VPCEPIIKKGRVVGFICSSKKIKDKLQRCYVCSKPATVLCDAPIGSIYFDRACNKPMCREHAHNIGPDNDVCDEHNNEISIKYAKENRKNLEKWGWKREGEKP